MRSLLLSGLVLAAASPAQEPWSDATATPPLLRLRVAGPDVWRSTLMSTNLGGLLAAQEATPYTDRWISWLRATLASLGEDESWQALREYRGAVDLEVRVAYEARATPPYRLLAVLRMTEDDPSHLAAIGAAIAAALRDSIPSGNDVIRGDSAYEVLTAGDESITVPFRRDGDLVMVAAHDLPHAMPRALAIHDTMVARRAAHGEIRRPDEPLLTADLDLQQVVTLALSGSAPGAPDRRIAEIAFGTKTLRELRFALQPAGPHVMFELSATFAGDERGIFRGLFPDRQGPPRLVRLIPARATSWKAGRFRLDLLVDTFIDVLTAAFGRDDRAKVDQELERDLGFPLIDGLLAHLGDEVLLLGGAELGRARNVEELLHGTCIVFELGDAQSFAENWPKAHDEIRNELGHDWDTVERGGATIESGARSFLSTSIHVSVTDELALVAFGDAGLELLKGVLDRRREKNDSSFPPAVRRVLRHAPPGFNGAGVMDAQAGIAGHLGIVGELLDDVLPASVPGGVDREELEAALTPLWGMLAKYRLDRVVTLTGYEKGRWAIRVLW